MSARRSDDERRAEQRARGLDHEELLVKRGSRTGEYVIVAVHSTLLGPALGGARLWRYARRRDRGRTAPLRGDDLQGGRGWVGSGWRKGGSLRRAGAVAPERRALMLDLGDVVDSLGGDYITAEDVGTGAADMAIVAERLTGSSGSRRKTVRAIRAR